MTALFDDDEAAWVGTAASVTGCPKENATQREHH